MSTLAENLEASIQMQRRAVQDMLQMATADFWERRAKQFEWAMPRPDDFLGRATEQEVAERAKRLRSAAPQCRAQAFVMRGGLDG